MRKPGPRRHGLLALIADQTDDGGYFCPSVYSNSRLHPYGLTVWDTLSITMAEKAGLIEQQKESFYRLTDAGYEMLQKYPFQLVCEPGKPCQQCIRSGMAEEPETTEF